MDYHDSLRDGFGDSSGLVFGFFFSRQIDGRLEELMKEHTRWYFSLSGTHLCEFICCLVVMPQNM
jgi:hypothetical protein